MKIPAFLRAMRPQQWAKNVFVLAAYGFALKVANAFMILLTSLVLQALGFVPNVEQTDQVKIGLRLLYGVLPLVMFIAAAIVLRGFDLDEREHARIRAELDARR